MTLPQWAALVAGYPFLVALVVAWMRGATSEPDPPTQVVHPTMTVAVFGEPVARWEIIEHVAPDGEVLEFRVFETPGRLGLDEDGRVRTAWTIDEVADQLAALDRLPEATR